MTTTTDKPEARIMSAYRAHMERLYPDAKYYPEARFGGRTIDLVIDIADGSTDLLIVAEGKAQLDDTVIEQARLSVGVCDLCYVVVPRPLRVSSEFERRVAVAAGLGIGVILVDRGAIHEEIHGSGDPLAQPDRLREALAGHAGEGEAGAAHGEVTPESAWHREIESEAADPDGLPTYQLNRRTGRRYATNQSALTAMRRAIRDGRVAVREVKGSIVPEAVR